MSPLSEAPRLAPTSGNGEFCRPRRRTVDRRRRLSHQRHPPQRPTHNPPAVTAAAAAPSWWTPTLPALTSPTSYRGSSARPDYESARDFIDKLDGKENE